jgi:hypothetical protein
MSDVFISYSRLDRDFVGKLREALTDQQQEVWIDWESIPPSQAWWGEIQKGIARANNFVVVLSPNSMASPICQMEIEAARQLGKRIIPVLHLDYNRDDTIKAMALRLATPDQDAVRQLWGSHQPHSLYDANDSVLKHINYFFFRPEDDFAARFSALLTVIRTDYEHKERHTTYELRALEWDRRQRNVSFLLLDDELAGAKEWLIQSEGKEPPPTTLQREYIQASEKRTRQLRSIRRASIIGSAVAVLALMFAVAASVIGVQATVSANSAGTREANASVRESSALAQVGTATVVQGQAEARADAAGTQVADANATLTPIPITLTAVAAEVEAGEARIESLGLAAAAVDILNAEGGNAETAALLGIRALRTVYTEQADTALVRATDNLYTLQSISVPTGDVTGALALDDGRFLSWSDDNTLRLWSRDGAPLATLSGHTNAVTGAMMLDDGRFLSWSDDNTLRLWSGDGTPLAVLVGHTSRVTGAMMLDDGRFLSWSDDNTLRLWSGDGTPLAVLVGHTNRVSGALALDDGRFLSWSDDNTLRLWSGDGAPLATLTGHTDFVSGALALDDGRFLSWSWDGTLRLWSRDGAPLATLSGHTNAVTGAMMLDDGRFLSWSGDGTLRLWADRPDAFIAYACTRVFRDFTPDERTLYGIDDLEPTCPQFAVDLIGYADGAHTTPFPLTRTGVPTRTIPARTPIQSPTNSLTPTTSP